MRVEDGQTSFMYRYTTVSYVPAEAAATLSLLQRSTAPAAGLVPSPRMERRAVGGVYPVLTSTRAATTRDVRPPAALEETHQVGPSRQ